MEVNKIIYELQHKMQNHWYYIISYIFCLFVFSFSLLVSHNHNHDLLQDVAKWHADLTLHYIHAHKATRFSS